MRTFSTGHSLGILILYNWVEALLKGEALDILAEQETARVAQELSAGLRGLGYRVQVLGVFDDLDRALSPFPPEEWLVFNLCEGLAGDPAREAEVPSILEAHGFLYTGAPGEALAICQNKAQAKERLLAHGLATPPYAVLSSPGEPCDVPLPALVKPLHEDGSLGITWESVVRDAAGLAQRVAYVLERYEQPALVEQFIGGREFNQSVWGNNPPEALPSAEVDFGAIADPLQRMVTYEAKWVEGSFAYANTPVICPAQVDPALDERLRETAVAAYQLLGCRDYARVDMRELDGVPYILEVNPNPTLASDAGFLRAARAAGFDQPRMAERIVQFALERKG